jgi:cytochrome c heme-lyase|eukprot:g7481.t1
MGNAQQSGESSAGGAGGAPTAATATKSRCPVGYGKQIDHPMLNSAKQAKQKGDPIKVRIDPRNMMPTSGTNERKLHSKQTIPLSTGRRRSTIPKGSFTPTHQEQDKGVKSDEMNWVYPSEQMFYNAMERKGWDPNAADMQAVVQIHNAVNERTWGEVLKWERLHQEENATEEGPRLVKFLGRPQDLSPKARFLHFIGYAKYKPFDRHDWTVERGSGKQVRYVIDFYGGKQDPNSSMKPIAFHLDVRPAIDSFEAVYDRIYMGLFHDD